MLSRKIDKGINEFVLEYGLEPKYLIMSSGAYGELCYEQGIKKGLEENDALIYELSEYNFIDIAIAVKNDIDFELR